MINPISIIHAVFSHLFYSTSLVTYFLLQPSLRNCGLIFNFFRFRQVRVLSFCVVLDAFCSGQTSINVFPSHDRTFPPVDRMFCCRALRNCARAFQHRNTRFRKSANHRFMYIIGLSDHIERNRRQTTTSSPQAVSNKISFQPPQWNSWFVSAHSLNTRYRRTHTLHTVFYIIHMLLFRSAHAHHSSLFFPLFPHKHLRYVIALHH